LVLGEKLWEEKGKTIGMSVKSVGPEGIRMEQTFTTEVKGLGRSPNGVNMGTLDFVQTPSGGFGTGQGIFTSQDGDIVVWKCYFIGKIEAGKNKAVNIIHFMTTSQKLSWFNSLVAVEDAFTDMKTGEIGGIGYEWK